MPRTRASAVGGGMRIATGKYTGNGAVTQAIVGVGFQPRYVIIWRQATFFNPLEMAFETNQNPNLTKCSQGTSFWSYLADHIVSLDAGGFTVGDGTGSANAFNAGAVVYTYTAFG